jgi:hypothetical protein
MDKRMRTVRHHSATHLMHKALREVLGTHVQQKGSLVDADKTRFDFSHNAPMTADEIRRVEDLVNAEVLRNEATNARTMPIDDAQKLGAMMLFGEKYGDEVRVLDIGSSRELCGGTHVSRTGDIGLFRIVAEGGVAAGIRRVEAIAGTVALALVRQESERLARVAGTLKAQPQEIEAKLAQVLESMKALEKEAARAKQKAAASAGDDLAGTAEDVKGVKVLAARLEGADVKTLRDTLDQLKNKLKSSAIVLAASEGEKVSLIAGVTQDLIAKVKAGELVNFVALQVGGKGGGRPDMAQAGGTNPKGLPDALASVKGWVRSACSRAILARGELRGEAGHGQGDHRRRGVHPRRRRDRVRGTGAHRAGRGRELHRDGAHRRPPDAQARPSRETRRSSPRCSPTCSRYYHPQQALRLRGRAPHGNVFRAEPTRNPPGFAGATADVRVEKTGAKSVRILDADGHAPHPVRLREAQRGRGDPRRQGQVHRDHTRNPREPRVRYWHPEREFKWTPLTWKFKTSVADRPFESGDSRSSFSSDVVFLVVFLVRLGARRRRAPSWPRAAPSTAAARRSRGASPDTGGADSGSSDSGGRFESRRATSY